MIRTGPVRAGPPVSHWNVWRTVAICAIAIAIGGGLTLLPESNTAILVAAIFLSVIGAVIVKARFGRLDPFEPIVPFAVMWVVMFVLRPIAMGLGHDYTLREAFNAKPDLDQALALALVGGITFFIGYSFRIAPPPAANKSARRVSLPFFPTVMVATIAGAAGLAVTIDALRRGSLNQFAYGQEGQSAYLYYSPLLATPAALLFFALRSGYRPALRAAGLAIAAIVVVSYWLAGIRFYGILPVASVVIYFYLHRGKRPGLVAVMVALIIAGLGLSALASSRGDSTAAASAVHSSPFGRLLLGATTEELPALAIEVQTKGNLWHPEPGFLLYSTAVHWIPKSLWPNKPKSYAETLYADLFPADYQISRANTEFTIIGDFYYDSGLIGVALGMALLGFLLRFLYDRLVVHSSSDLSLIAYAPVTPLLVLLLRGDISLTLGKMLYVYAPLLIALLLARRHPRPSTVPPVVTTQPQT
ncbi:MAG: O-antigen polymerase [Solirubrobacteraceae bacterium]